MILSEKKVYNFHNGMWYAGCIDILTGFDDFDTPRLTYNDEFHTYKIDGNIVPSVTQLLDTGEYNNVPEEVLEYARQKGTLVHKEIEEYLKEGKLGFTQEFEEFKRLFIKYRKLFDERAVFDIKTYSSNTKDKKEKCYNQTCMYGDAVEYLKEISKYSPKVGHHYEIWLPHNKSGRIIDLDAFMEGKKVEYK